jgi:hypothetical protein
MTIAISRVRRFKFAAILGVASLQGCVTSQFPLLDDKTVIVDGSLSGRYTLPTSPDQQRAEYDIYLKAKEYLLAQNGKLTYIATLHQWHANTYLAQLRSPAKTTSAGHPSPSPYVYMIVKKTESGLDLNLIGCTINDPCKVDSVQELFSLATAAEQKPEKQQLETLTKMAGYPN